MRLVHTTIRREVIVGNLISTERIDQGKLKAFAVGTAGDDRGHVTYPIEQLDQLIAELHQLRVLRDAD